MTATTMRWTLAACGLAFAGIAGAQYKSVGPDGTVTYSDRPPPATSRILNEKKAPETTTATAPLPFAVQAAVSRYPVVLYTGDRCSPCDDARNYLRSRGIPFNEKTVTSDDDIAAFRQQSPDGTAPVVSVGGRKTIGFSQTQLGSVLDSAGYPAQSALPPGYQNPVPTPLSPNTRVAGQAVSAPPASDAPVRPTAPPPAAPTTPPGFRF